MLMKYFGPKFIQKHQTTLLLFIVGLLDKLPLPIPPEIKTQVSTGITGLAIWIATYLIAGKIDSVPAKPEIIKD
jgi:hypothetical protein